MHKKRAVNSLIKKVEAVITVFTLTTSGLIKINKNKIKKGSLER